METEYVVVIMIASMTMFGRDGDLSKAIDRAKREAKAVAKNFGGFKKGTDVPINVYDITGHPDIRIEESGVFDVFGKSIDRLTCFSWRAA